MLQISKIKIAIFTFCSLGVFALGRSTAPKPQPQIKIEDNTKSVEQAIENTKKQMQQEFQKKVVREKHTVRNKNGVSKTDVKEVITYNKKTTENVDKKLTDNLQTKSQKSTEVTPVKNECIDYTFMVGRSFFDPRYDYFASVGIPLFYSLKASAGYEVSDHKFFVGGTISYFSLMVGRSFSDTKYDYLAMVGIPIFNLFKADLGYEVYNQRFFVGASLDF